MTKCMSCKQSRAEREQGKYIFGFSGSAIDLDIRRSGLGNWGCASDVGIKVVWYGSGS